MHKSREKIAYLLGRYGAIYHHEPQLPSHVDSTNHVQAEPCPGYFNDWCLTSWCPSCAGMKIRANTAFILKVDGCPEFFRSLFDLRKNSLFPLFDLVRVLLISSKQWFLATQAQLSQKPADRGIAKFDPKLLAYQNSNHCPGPKRKRKFHLKRIFINHNPVNPGQMATTKLLGPARSSTGFQAVQTPGPVTGKPVVNACPGKSKGFYDFFGTFSLLNQRTTVNRDTRCGTPQGSPVSPLLSNLYMRRFILGWKHLGYEQHWSAYIVSYADDFVICCKAQADQAMGAMRRVMEKLKLTVNEDKSHLCHLPQEEFDFLGFTFGRFYNRKTGGPISAPNRRGRASNGW